jgi:mono/diheme cytochrome c family protein
LAGNVIGAAGRGVSYEATVRIRKRTDALAVIAFCSALAAASDASAATSRGGALSESWCSQCHAVKPNQFSAHPAAPSFRDVAAESSITEYSLRVILRTPHSTMPNIMINSEDMDDIVSYILSFKPQQ